MKEPGLHPWDKVSNCDRTFSRDLHTRLPHSVLFTVYPKFFFGKYVENYITIRRYVTEFGLVVVCLLKRSFGQRYA